MLQTSTDLGTAPEPSRLEALAEEISQLVNHAKDLGRVELQAFQTNGVPLSAQWRVDYDAWATRHSKYAAIVAELLPGLPSLNPTTSAWIEPLRKKAKEIRESQELAAAALREISECLQRIQGLRPSPQGVPDAILTPARTLATSLLTQFSGQSGPEEVLTHPQYDALKSVLLLIDAAAGAPLSFEARKIALIQVREAFGEELSMGLMLGGVIAPPKKAPIVVPQPAPPQVVPIQDAVSKITLGSLVRPSGPAVVSMAAGQSSDLKIPIEDLLPIQRKMENEVQNWKAWGDNKDKTVIYQALIDTIKYIESIATDDRWEQDHVRSREEFKQAVQYLATFQSALRIQCEPLRDDHQFQIFHWLQRVTKEHSVFVAKHMKLTDPAMPADVPDVREQLRLAITRWGAPPMRSRILKQLSDEVKKPELDWNVIFDLIETLVVKHKTPPSSVEIRDVLLTSLNRLPDGQQDFPESFKAVRRAIDEYLRQLGDRQETILPSGGATDEVRELKELIAGRSVMVIGGVPDPYVIARLKQAFELEEVIWNEARHGEPIVSFSIDVRNPKVVLVLAVIHWMSHAHGDIKDYCDDVGKPFVRLLAGINPNRVAHDVLGQCGDKLRSQVAGVRFDS